MGDSSLASTELEAWPVQSHLNQHAPSGAQSHYTNHAYFRTRLSMTSLFQFHAD